MMSEQTTRRGILKLDGGFEITYHSIGNEANPLLLFVVGSSGLGSLYQRLAKELCNVLRCVYYDKRGFLPVDADGQTAAKQKNPLVSVEHHADDGAALLKHLSPMEPAYVFGTSTGGTAVLDLTIRYPELVHTAVLHEPITFSVIRDPALKDEMTALYRKVGAMQSPTEAFPIFASYMFNPPETEPKDGSRSNKAETSLASERKTASAPSLVQLYNGRQGHQEAIAMVNYVVDEQQINKLANKIVLVCGKESIDQRVSEPGKALAQTLQPPGRIWELDGDHMSFATKKHATSFSKQLLSALHQEDRISSTRRKSLARM